MADLVDRVVEMGHDLFDYNRENYFFDSQQKVEREYQEQDMRVKLFVLYREDIRDLVKLTTGKMDAYMPPIVFELGIGFLMLVHGEFDESKGHAPAPDWVFWLYVINLAESFLYLFLAAWLCSHASVCAHSFGVRLLTQYVRLPVPSTEQLDSARRFAAEFEASQVMRIPVVREQAAKLDAQNRAQAHASSSPLASAASTGQASDAGREEATPRSAGSWTLTYDGRAEADLPTSSGPASSAPASGAPARNERVAAPTSSAEEGWRDSHEHHFASFTNNPASGEAMLQQQGEVLRMHDQSSQVLTLAHIQLYRQLQSNWQAHDAYCRCCVALGTYTLVHAIAYFIIGYFVVELSAPGPAFFTACILVLLSWLMVRLDLYFGKWCLAIVPVLLMQGPILAVVCLTLFRSSYPAQVVNTHYVLVAWMFALQALLILTVLFVARAEHVNHYAVSADHTDQEEGSEPRTTSVAIPTRFRTVLYLDVFGWFDDPETGSQSEEQRRLLEQSSCPEGATSLPAPHWKSLCSDCRRSFKNLAMQVRAWSDEGSCIREQILEIDGNIEQLAFMHRRFEDIRSELRTISAAHCPTSNAVDIESVDDDQDFWLRLVDILQPSSEDDQAVEIEYFVNPKTGVSKPHSDLPPLAQISDLDLLCGDIALLNAQVQVLKSSPPSRRRFSEPGSPLLEFGRKLVRQASRRRNSSPSSTDDASGIDASDLQLICRTRSSTETTDSALGMWANSPAPAASGSHISLQPWLEQQPRIGRQFSRPRHGAIADTELRAAFPPSFNGSNPSRSPSPNRSQGSGSLCEEPATGPASFNDPPLVNESASSAQETRFGGREAGNIGGCGCHFRTTAASAKTFFPQQDNTKEAKTEPGQVPWVLFLNGSLVLVMVWGAGAIYYIVHMINLYSQPLHEKAAEMLQAENAPLLTGGRLVFKADAWQHRPAQVSLLGLACNAALGSQAFVTEQYGVHQLNLGEPTSVDGNSSHSKEARLATRVTSIDRCLAQVPKFQREGLQGMSLECNSAGGCDALLLGMGGTQIVRCPLRDQTVQRAPVSVSLARSAGKHAWGAITARTACDGSKHLWGLPGSHSSSPRKLKFQVGSSGFVHAVPTTRLDLYSTSPNPAQHPLGDLRGKPAAIHAFPARPLIKSLAAIQQMQVYEDSALLGLSEHGYLMHAWKIERPVACSRLDIEDSSLHLGSWRLPSDFDAQAMCATDKDLFVARRASEKSNGPEVWRFDLPSPVVACGIQGTTLS